MDDASILTSIKKLLGISKDVTSFDVDIKMHINTAFTVLTQLGVGPSKGFAIKDETSKWTDFIPEDPTLESVKTYVYLKTKMVFDPSASSAVMEANKSLINELEWRLNVTAEGGIQNGE